MLKFLAGILICIVAISCGSSSDDPDPTTQVIAPTSVPEIEVILTDNDMRTWMTKNFTLAGMNLECREDDTFQFMEDGTFKFDGGDMLCGLEDILKVRTGTWKVLIDENRIEFDLGSQEIYYANYQKITEEEIRLTGSWAGMKLVGTFVPSDS